MGILHPERGWTGRGESRAGGEAFFGGRTVSERLLALRTGLAAGVPLSERRSVELLAWGA